MSEQEDKKAGLLNGLRVFADSWRYVGAAHKNPEIGGAILEVIIGLRQFLRTAQEAEYYGYDSPSKARQYILSGDALIDDDGIAGPISEHYVLASDYEFLAAKLSELEQKMAQLEVNSKPALDIQRLRYRTRPDGMIERINDPDERAPSRDNQDILGGCGNAG